ncbi:MAG: zinc-binding dehydrogenase [Actinomycetota bacterium]|jgi:(R,R)-butanediol dehydrogenase / meso-butanediol dehydrogenase / diacetyl reductase|nr:zinc-binding dehydrogenase [Actinomycetota bacterium]
MRAGLITGKETLELLDFDEPTPADDEVVIEIDRCGICGSDVHAYVDGWAYAPGLCGHEWVGRVAAAGRHVSNVEEGELVTGGVSPGCGACPECRADLPHHCRTAAHRYSGKGGPRSGGFAPFMNVYSERVVAIPESISLDDAALIEPASVAMHAVRRSRMQIGDVVCVVGCGPIGLLTAQCARIGGAGLVIAIEPDEGRRQLALATGADLAAAPGEEARQVINDATGGLRADIAFDCAGIPQTMQQSIDMVRQGGSICVVGVTGGKAEVTPMRWMMKEVAVDTSLVFTLDEMKTVARLIDDGRLVVSPLHHGTVTLDELAATVDDLANRRTDAVKILVDPTAG